MFTRAELERYINDGGVTLDMDAIPVSFDSGYQVAQRAGETIINAQDVDAVYSAVRERLDYINRDDWFAFVGLWIDNGMAYIDISYHIKDKDDAIEVGIREKQLSIYDWNMQDCIYL